MSASGRCAQAVPRGTLAEARVAPGGERVRAALVLPPNHQRRPSEEEDIDAHARPAVLQQLVELLDHEIRSPLTVLGGWAELRHVSAVEGRSVDVGLVLRVQRAITALNDLSVDVLEEVTARLGRGEGLDGAALQQIVRHGPPGAMGATRKG